MFGNTTTTTIWRRRFLIWFLVTGILTLGWLWWDAALSSTIPVLSEYVNYHTDPLSEEGERIVISRIGLSSPLVFPVSLALDDLKAALEKGVVHYPESAFPTDPSGNVFFFGHSSSRREKNPARTAFTKLKDVLPGDTIEIWHQDRVYVWRVERLKILKPGEAEIYFSSDKRMLTLSTCWPVGDPENRFIVEAFFVRSYPQRSYSAAGLPS